MQTIDIVLYDGFDEVDAIAPFEVLVNGGFTVRLVTLDGARPVRGSHGAVVQADGALGDPVAADLVLVPGGGWNDRAEQGAYGEVNRGDLPRRLAEIHAQGTPLASVCTGGMILAAAGVLDGRHATTHRSALDELAATPGVTAVTDRVVDEGEILTCGGVTSGLDLALHLVERERGGATAAEVAKEMEHDRAGRVRQVHG
ncbi:MAG TPA: DJ-1/PfpI family protein [Solirubrobacteraceae bacterium]|nr:DJ-1/PfpI family protein [Solirubrobacteraceae bacterium]